MTVALAVQPGVIQRLAARPELRSRGFLARFLFSQPRSLVGSREVAPPPVLESVRLAYEQLIHALWHLKPIRDESGEILPRTLPISDEARSTLRAFQRDLEPRLGPGGDLAPIAEWASKLVGAIARIAGVMHVVRSAESLSDRVSPIDAEAMTCAIEIGVYFLEYAQTVGHLMEVDPATEDARAVLRWVARRGEEGFSARDCFEGMKGRLRHMDRLRDSLALLVSHGYVRPVSQPPRRGPGRPRSQRYEVNPQVVAP